jgi:hypothetical protein
MDTGIDLNETAVHRTGRLKKTGEEYLLVSLSAQHIDQILALKELAFAHLGERERVYLANNKDRVFFEDHFSAGNAVIGIVHDSRLIAQAIIVNPTAARPETGIDIEMDVPIETVAVLQGAIVHPDYRGNNLQAVLVDERIAVSERNGRTEVFAEVALGNSFSWGVLMQKGLHIESTGISPYTGAEVYVLRGHVPSLRGQRQGAVNDCIVCQLTDVDQQKELLAAGYRGTRFNADEKTLTFERAAMLQRALRNTPRP